MERHQSFKVLLACGAAVSLQGCIAAAFPLAAGGLMAGEGRIQPDAEPATQASPPPVTPDAEVAASTPPAGQTTGLVEVELSTSEPAGTAGGLTGNSSIAAIDAATTRIDAADAEESAPSAGPVEIETIETAATAQFATAEPAQDPVGAALDQSDVASVMSDGTQEPAIIEVPSAPLTDIASSAATQVDTPMSGSADKIEAASTSVAEIAPSVTPEIDTPMSGSIATGEAIVEEPTQTAELAAGEASAAVGAAAGANEGASVSAAVPLAIPATGTLFDPLFSYASAPEFVGDGERLSATLINPTGLDPARAKCTIGRPTILIDLDPAEGQLLPIDTRTASPALADRLSQLRRSGIVIAWISGQPIEISANLRAALFRSGLDLSGNDELLLMRNLEDRKQTRRDQLAQNTCLIAIAGDERADFHELFDYLRNPADAAALEPMMNEGWFIIPTPLLPENRD